MRSMARVKSARAHRVGSAAGGDQGRLVDQVGQISPGEAGRQPRHGVEVDVGSDDDLADVHLEDGAPAAEVGPIHQHLAVEAARAQQRRVEDLRPVGRGQQDHADARVEAVELGQQLVQRLLLLVHAAGDHARAGATEGVELVDEDDRGRRLARLLEQVAHPRRADADEHLDELRAGDREERHAGLAGHGAGQQRLAGSRRADQQDALRHVRAEPAIALRILQEGDDLLQLELGLVDAGHVGERRLGVRLDVDLRAGLPDRQQPAEARRPRLGRSRNIQIR